MNLYLEHRLALVSASTAGIGLAIASTLAAEGAMVIVNGRSEDRVQRAKANILDRSPNANVETLVADLSTVAGAKRAAERFPHIDILVNNLGFYTPKAFEQILDENWLEMIETNFLSGVRLSRFYLSGMKAVNWGRIVFISSESGVNIPTEMIHYGVSKTMQIALARGLANTTAGTGITVNSVLVGPTRSEGVERFVQELALKQQKTTSDVEKDFFLEMRPTSLVKRFAQPEEIAAVVAFLASPWSALTNGAAIRAEGGIINSIL